MEKRSILIADDDANVTDVLYEIFNKNGYKAYKAYNGKGALEIYHEHRPQLAILDFDMPYRTGLEVTRTIRKNDHSTLVIILTGFMIKEKDSLECYESGANLFIRKPISYAEIFACVHSMMDTAFGPINETLRLQGFVLDVSAQTLSDENVQYKLKDREVKTLQLLLKHKNKVVSLEDLTGFALQNEVDHSNAQMLRNIISNLNKILRTDPAILIESVYSHGYILRVYENKES